ncbi:hypothetical protein SISNIDRAFT_405697 [Sistotremastrum niveocremeum HHB9708]|uniref:RNA polymerase III transcription factor IIIC subunit n=1 Tax=Sistotremastrum niveocremeum HHB9708 TaxID=1314777 RepID=A0A164ZTW3_9AGAM|nr:hypothetical protein SISNIDRAFT_405697 [Sistotremastrum niveocremeum HHB9708]
MDGETSSRPKDTPAPEYAIPQAPFYSIEYPGYVAEGSVPRAIEHLGGQRSLDAAFKRNASKKETLLELNFRPGNPFSHPIPGDVTSTDNILMKVTKRKRKRKSAIEGQPLGEYTVELMGVIPKTARFRSMADFQFQPDPNDPLVKLRYALDYLDAKAIREFQISPEKEDYYVEESAQEPDEDGDIQMGEPSKRSNLRLFPPPIFGRQTIAQVYNFKANPGSIETSIVDEETGEERKRLINRSRWKGFAPVSIGFWDPTPDTPPKNALDAASSVNPDLLSRLKEHFNTRPVWSRPALLNQFAPNEQRALLNAKQTLPLVSYIFQDGPWRDTNVRLGYDPRTDKETRFYQRVYFRNVNHEKQRTSFIARRSTLHDRMVDSNAERSDDALPSNRSHIFDGRTRTSQTASFQLCDIQDPMLIKMIHSEEALRDTCNEQDGWYTSHALENLKTVLRHKFFNLLEGNVVSDEECEALLQTAEGSTRPRPANRTLNPRKHNMAKGALPPEEATAARLRSVIGKRLGTVEENRDSMDE